MDVYNNGHDGIPKNNPTIDCGYHCTTDAGVDQTTCSGTVVTLTGTRPTSGTWHALGSNPAGTSLGSTSGGVASLNIPLGVHGTFSFIYQSGYCTDTMDVVVIAKSNAGADQQICGGHIATLTGTAPNNGTWSAQAGNPVGATLSTTSGGVATVTFADASTGNFNFIYTSPAGCTDTMTVAVTPKPLAGADQSICAGNTVQLSGLVLSTGTWSSQSGNPTGATLSSTVAGVATSSFTPTSLGDYYYIYTSTFCTDTMKVKVVQPMADIQLAAGSHAYICVGNTTTLTDANAGGVWTSSNIAVATVNSTTGVVTGIADGYAVISYTVPSVTICGCNIKTFTVFVNSSPSLQPIQGPGIVCVGSMITLMDPSGGGNWSTSNADVDVNSSGNVTGVTPGTVTVFYTATNGCGSDIKSTTITVCQPIASIVGATNLCVGGSATLTDATAGGTWSSSDNSVATITSGGVVNAVGAGNVTITYTAPVGTSCCSNVSSAYIYVSNAPILAAIQGPGVVCSGQMITLMDPSGGGSWSTSDNTIATVNSSGNVIGVAAGTATITYTSTNACGNTSKNATVVVGGLPLAVNVGTSNICVGSTATFTNATVGGTWSSSDNSIATVDNAGVVTGVASGSATIRYTVSAGTVCGTNVATTNIYVNSVPVLAPIMGGGVVCAGSMITLMDPSGGGNWSSSDNTIATVNSSGNVFGVAVGTATITYTVNYFCGGVLHTQTQNATVYVQGVLAYITGNTNICGGTTSTLSCTTAGGTWSSTNTAVATVDNAGVVTAHSAGYATINYTVAAGSVCGSNVANAYVVVSTTPTVAPFVGTTSICANTMTTLMCPSGGGNWSSSDNSIATINSSGNVFAVSAGTTTITYTANTTCGSASRNVTFTVMALPATPTISGSLVVCNGASTVLTSSYTTGNQWYKDGSAIVGANGQTLTVSTPGSYTVVSNNGGTCYSLPSSAALVNAGVVYGFSINVNPQELGGNNFIFTAATPVTNNSYTWDFGDGTISTVINPSRTYAAADTYSVKQIVINNSNNCKDSSIQLAIVVSCCVTSGSTGGTESKSLGNVISQRFFNRVTNSISEKLDYAKLNRIVSLPGVQVMGIGGNVTLQSLLPGENSVSSVLGGTVNAYPTSPADLVTFTNALDVQALDYTKNSSCKAVAFATKTSGMVYSHTKPVCDRLKEAVLQDIQNVTIGNITFVQYRLQQYTGVIEYAISFSAGKNSNSNFYEIQSKWLSEDYTGLDTMYNFQIWGVNPQVIKSMVSDILTNLNNSMPYYQLTYSPVPQTYIMSHRRNQKSMDITINNNTSSTSANLYVTDYMNELSPALPYRVVPVTINPNGKTIVSVDMEDKYQADVKMYDANNSFVNDEMYSNDGPWDISYNAANTTIGQFNISNDALTNADNEWRLFRNVTLNAVTSDYVSVFKMMKAAGLPRDISKYNGFRFTANASGAGALKITFVKNSITDWNSQYSITIPAKQGTQDYTINYADLVSAGLGSIDASDITAITISFMVNSGTSTSLNATISNAKLINTSVVVSPTVDTKLGIYPNPVINSSFTASFKSNKNETLVLKVIETGSGKVVHTETINSVAGQNSVFVKLNKSLVSANNYIVKLEGESTKYDVQNIVINKQ